MPALAVPIDDRRRFIEHAAAELARLGDCVPLRELAASIRPVV